jgi:hypothetical protein
MRVSKRNEEDARIRRSTYGGLLQVGDQVVPVLGLLQTGEGHLGTRNVLLGVLEVLEKEKQISATWSLPLVLLCLLRSTHFEQSVLLPYNTLVNVGGSVREAIDLSRLSAKETVQSGSNLVGTSSFNGVALSTSGLEETGSLGRIT